PHRSAEHACRWRGGWVGGAAGGGGGVNLISRFMVFSFRLARQRKKKSRRTVKLKLSGLYHKA
ncbi:MAG: hypothetical protein OXD44_02595, partial [Gammaproteobacteria bacterium]|nr:hypothetical protein [Gammaproteobacteria bacterium]